MSSAYEAFLASKRAYARPVGHHVDPIQVHPRLFGFQRDMVTWAVGVGRAAVFADVGLGKSGVALEWARLSGATSLVVTPLAVSEQLAREAALLDIDARYVRRAREITGPGVWITNYEMIEHFDPARLDAVVLDESSILKAHDGKTRARLIAHFAAVPRRLTATATPAPNDPEEMTGQAEFLGHATRADMLSTYFIHDADGWRVKRHARHPMFDWLATWAVAAGHPRDLGYDQDGYDLPALHLHPVIVEADLPPADGELFTPAQLGGVSDRARVRRETVRARCEAAAALVAAEPDEPWLLWCGLNAEADLLAELIDGAVNVHGSLSPEEKAAGLLGFADGDHRVLVTKPSIAAHGLNFQHCARQAFVGMSDSFEQWHQCLGRSRRFGQRRDVHAHIVLSNLERSIFDNVRRKQHAAQVDRDELIAATARARTVAPVAVAA